MQVFIYISSKLYEVYQLITVPYRAWRAVANAAQKVKKPSVSLLELFGVKKPFFRRA